MGNAEALTRDLIQRVPGQALIEKLMSEWDAGRIRLGEKLDEVVIDEDARGWYWGVLGERRVGERLAALGPEWTVLHSVPVGSGTTDIDHVAIGPSGVVTINTKYSSDAKVWVAGRGLIVNGSSRAQYLRNSMAELNRVTALLSNAAGFAVPVSSLLVFVAPASLTVKDTPGWDGVALEVLADHQLLALASRRRELSDEQLTRVLDVALVAETWHRAPRDEQPGRNYTTRAPRARSAPRRPARGRKRSAAERIVMGLLGVIAMPVVGYLVLTGFMNALLQR